jgi:hypothetical protein
MKRCIGIILLIMLSVGLTGCGNNTAFSLFKVFGDNKVYVIEKWGNNAQNWEKMVIVFGFADDFSAGKDIAKYLSGDGGRYRVVKLKDK